MNKKAISGIVTTALVIALAVAIGAIVSTLIISPIRIKLGPEISCTQMQLQSTVTINDACYSQESNEIRVSLTRSLSSQNLQEIRFSLADANSTSKSWSCTQSCGTCSILNPGETRTYYLDQQYSRSKITLTIDGCVIATKDLPAC